MKLEEFGAYEPRTLWEHLGQNQRRLYTAIFTISIPWLFSHDGAKASPHRSILMDKACKHYEASGPAQLWARCMEDIEKTLCGSPEEITDMRIIHLDILTRWLDIENEVEFLREAKELFLDVTNK